MKINQVKIKKKRSFCDLYGETIGKILYYLTIFSFILFSIYGFIVYIYPYHFNTLLSIIVIIHIITTIVYLFGIVLVWGIISYMQASNLRYIPISHEECAALGILTIEQYLHVINRLMVPFDTLRTYSYVITQDVIKDIRDFCKKEFNRDVSIRCNDSGQYIWCCKEDV